MAPALDPSSSSRQPPFWPMVSPGTPWLSHLSEALTSEVFSRLALEKF